jgi:UDP-glucose 4-epimerase
MNWLITGGCGFIGRNLIRRLKGDVDNRILVVDNLSVGTRSDLAQVCQFDQFSIDRLTAGRGTRSDSRVSLVAADILDDGLAIALCRGIDTVVHLAANTGVAPSVENPRADCMTNVVGILNYLEASRINRVKKFVFASSGAPIGECTPPIHEELAPHPVSPYGASKLGGEAYCSAYYRTFGVETVALRFGNVYGPYSGRKDSVVAKFIKKALDEEPLVIYGDGHQTRDFIYIDDLIEAILLAVHTPDVGGEIFQIASNKETTVGELVEQLLPIFKAYEIRNLDVQYGARRLGDVRRNFSDTAKALKYLKWKPQVDLATGLEQTLKWFLGDEATRRK